MQQNGVRGGQRFAIGILIIHFDRHRGCRIDGLIDLDRCLCGAIAFERDRQRLRQRDRLVGRIAVAIERRGALLHVLAAEGPAIPPLGRAVIGRERCADRNGQVRCAAARQITNKQIERNDRRPHHGVLRPADGRLHRRQAELVHAHRLIGIDRPVAPILVRNNHGQVIVTHRRAFGGGPAAFRHPVPADFQRLVELRVRSAVAQPQRPLEPVSKGKPAADRAAQYMLHIHRLAGPHQRPVKDGVKNILGRRITIRQVEIGRLDPLAPFGQREAEILTAARRHHQRVGLAVAIAIGLRVSQVGGDGKATLRIARAGRQRVTAAAVGDAHRSPSDRLATVERGHPYQRAVAAPLKVHRHVGHQRARRDIARRLPPEQRIAQHRACQLDHVEAGLRQRNADHLEVLARAGKPEFQRIALSLEQRFGAGIVDRLGLALRPFLTEIAIVGVVDLAQPFGDLPVRSVNFQACAADVQYPLRQLRLDRADRDRQHPAFLKFDNPERRGKLDQRRRNVELDRQRKALGIRQHTPARILDTGGDAQRRGHCGGERPLERKVADRRIALAVLIDLGLAHRPVGKGQADRFGLFHRDVGRKPHIGVADRIASRLRIDARAFPARLERLAHREVEALVARRRPPVGAGNASIPHQRHVAPRRERATAFDRDHRRERLRFVRRIHRHFLRQPSTFEEIAQIPVVWPQPVDDLHHDFGLEHIERDLFADAVDRAIAISRDRRGRRRDIGCDQKQLPLLDVVAIAPRHHRTRRRSPRVDGECLRPGDCHAARTCELAGEVNRAANPTGQRLFEIEHECLWIDPAPC